MPNAAGKRARLAGLTVGLLALLLSGCASGGSAAASTAGPQPSPVSSPSPNPAPPVLLFCVGVSPPLQTREGDSVTVRFVAGQAVFEQAAAVGTRVSVRVPPGPFKVLVKGRTEISGTIAAGETRSGSIGTGCPA